MGGSVVNLSVHKNTQAQRREHEYRQEIRRAARQVGDELGGRVAGYAVVAWDDKLQTRAFWAGPASVIPTGCIPDHVANALRTLMQNRHTLRILGQDDNPKKPSA